MSNSEMHRKVEKGEAIDLSKCPREGDDYILAKFVDDKDYCDAKAERWIWSIGRRLSDGVILASTSTKFYQSPAYECLWLR